ncbi:pitrilysin family protein [Muribaculum sp.]|uniref:M16 family metallopeptidase n=1 Tax=Muribaculum sp. TaxID=1918611 RepID=UPI0023D3FD26|nr:pitrilysin family protein [Muribaculum sp.]MDE5704866.1 insulinase family protein [Muribaculum sp.]
MLDRITPPEVRPFGHLSLPPMERIALDNGIVLNVYDHSFQDVSELMLLTPGGVVDAMGSPVASMLVPVMLDGSRMYPGGELSDILDFNGAKVLPSVSDHFTGVSLRMLNSHWEKLLPVYADMIFSPQLDDHAVDTCRHRMAQSAAIAMQRVEYKAQKAVRELAYGADHPKAVMDTPQSVEAVSREEFLKWHNRIFSCNLSGAELFLSGRVTAPMIDGINRIFGSVAVDSESVTPPYIRPFDTIAPSYRFVESQGALQSAIRLAIPSIPRTHPDYIMLRCAVVALGGYFGSRLMSNIREDKGYTYGIQAGLLGSPEGTVMLVQTSADNAYAEAVVDEIRNEIRRLHSGDFTDEEMNRLRQYLMSMLAQHLDTAFSISACHVTERISFTGPDYFSRQVGVISSMTPDALCDVARRHLPLDKEIVVIAGSKV